MNLNSGQRSGVVEQLQVDQNATVDESEAGPPSSQQSLKLCRADILKHWAWETEIHISSSVSLSGAHVRPRLRRYVQRSRRKVYTDSTEFHRDDRGRRAPDATWLTARNMESRRVDPTTTVTDSNSWISTLLVYSSNQDFSSLSLNQAQIPEGIRQDQDHSTGGFSRREPVYFGGIDLRRATMKIRKFSSRVRKFSAVRKRTNSIKVPG